MMIFEKQINGSIVGFEDKLICKFKYLNIQTNKYHPVTFMHYPMNM